MLLFSSLWLESYSYVFRPHLVIPPFMQSGRFSFQTKALEDVKTSAAANVDTNGIRAIALDHLGAIAARLRSSQLRNAKSEDDPVRGLPPLEQVRPYPGITRFWVLKLPADLDQG